MYIRPQIDQVPPKFQVQLANHTGKVEVETVEEAIGLYLAAYGKQFTAGHGAHKKSLHLGRLVTYLKAQGHTMQLADLTYSDGQDFLDSLSHAYHGTPMSPQTQKQYKCALRSFGRFAANCGLVNQNLFFALTVQ